MWFELELSELTFTQGNLRNWLFNIGRWCKNTTDKHEESDQVEFYCRVIGFCVLKMAVVSSSARLLRYMEWCVVPYLVYIQITIPSCI